MQARQRAALHTGESVDEHVAGKGVLSPPAATPIAQMGCATCTP